MGMKICQPILSCCLLTFVLGCASTELNRDAAKCGPLQLMLLPIDNQTEDLPPAVLVRTHNKSGFKLDFLYGSTYAVGVGILLAKNNSNSTISLLPWWYSPKWRIRVRLNENEEKTFPLVPVFSYRFPFCGPKIILKPGEMAGMVVHAADDNARVLNEKIMDVPNDAVAMSVEYDDGTYRAASPPIWVYWRLKKKTHQMNDDNIDISDSTPKEVEDTD